MKADAVTWCQFAALSLSGRLCAATLPPTWNLMKCIYEHKFWCHSRRYLEGGRGFPSLFSSSLVHGSRPHRTIGRNISQGEPHDTVPPAGYNTVQVARSATIPSSLALMPRKGLYRCTGLASTVCSIHVFHLILGVISSVLAYPMWEIRSQRSSKNDAKFLAAKRKRAPVHSEVSRGIQELLLIFMRDCMYDDNTQSFSGFSCI